MNYERKPGEGNSDLDSVFLKKTHFCLFMTSAKNIPNGKETNGKNHMAFIRKKYYCYLFFSNMETFDIVGLFVHNAPSLFGINFNDLLRRKCLVQITDCNLSKRDSCVTLFLRDLLQLKAFFCPLDICVHVWLSGKNCKRKMRSQTYVLAAIKWIQ